MRTRLESWVGDLRHASRSLWRSRGFAATAILTLALGVGVNASVFAVAYGLLARPLPYPDARQLVLVSQVWSDGVVGGLPRRLLAPLFDGLQTVDAVAAYNVRDITLGWSGQSAVVTAAFVTEGFFEVLGVPASHGTAVATNERVSVSTPLAVRLGAPDVPRAIGVGVSVGGTVTDVGGVMPRGFAFPSDTVDAWTIAPSMRASTSQDDGGYFTLVARMKAGVSRDAVHADVERVLRQVAPDGDERPVVRPLGDSIAGSMSPVLYASAAAGLLVLFVAAANVATLFIGRFVARQREIAARHALGATTSRIVRGMLIEAGLVALLASICGMALATATLAIVVPAAVGVVPHLQMVMLDAPVVLCVAGLTAAIVLTCGALPLWQIARVDMVPFLRMTTAVTPAVRRARGALVIVQIALSTALLVGAGLAGRSIIELVREDTGIAGTDGRLEARVVLADQTLIRGPERDAFVSEALARVRALPGVRHAGLGSVLPPRPMPVTVRIRVATDTTDETAFLSLGSATPGALPAMGAQFVAGRDFEDADMNPDAGDVVILSESAARFLVPGKDPIGADVVRMPGPVTAHGRPRVIGVVRDIKHDGLDAPPGRAVYVPWTRLRMAASYVIVSSSADEASTAMALRRTLSGIDPSVPIAELTTFGDVMRAAVAGRRLSLLAAAVLGALALAVAMTGLLAMLWRTVAERRRELAIRAALGASSRRLSWIVLGQGLVLTGVGVAAGLGMAGGAARALSHTLYHVRPVDAATFVAVAVIVGAGALAASLGAARRATTVEPMAALRAD